MRVHLREKLGVFLLASLLLAAWGCGDDSADDTESPYGPLAGWSATPSVRAAASATASPAGTPAIDELPTSPPWWPTPTTGTPPTRVPTLPPGANAVVQIATATGLPGETVPVDVTLTSVEPGVEIVAMQDDIGLDWHARIAEGEGGDPACIVNPEINKELTVFGFLPFPCSEHGCVRVRAVVLGYNVDPIPEGSLLYTCNVAISPEAEPGGVFPLPCSGAGGADPIGGAVGLRCDDGQILVGSE